MFTPTLVLTNTHDLRYTPTFRGFDVYYGHYGGGPGNYWYHGQPNAACLDGFETDMSNSVGSTIQGIDMSTANGTYNTRLYTAYAENEIRTHFAAPNAAPMFMYLAYSAVHSAVGPSITGSGNAGNQAPLPTVARYDATINDDANKVVAAMITEVDWSLGSVKQALQDVGVWDRTVTIFVSDNGAHGLSVPHLTSHHITSSHISSHHIPSHSFTPHPLTLIHTTLPCLTALHSLHLTSPHSTHLTSPHRTPLTSLHLTALHSLHLNR
jgi:hypothetical protein